METSKELYCRKDMEAKELCCRKDEERRIIGMVV